MTNNFLYDNLTWKSFLSSAAKDIKEYNGIYSWKMLNKYQLAFSRPLTFNDIDYLLQFKDFSSYYVSMDNIDILKKVFKVKKTRNNSVIVPIENFSLMGNKYIKIRTAINKNIKSNFELSDDLKSYDDILVCLKRWDDTSGEKHFQVRSGKNRYFFKNQLHKEGISLFIYDANKLIAFGVLSLPNTDGCSSYVVGKALCYDYKGLSEYADVMLYKKAQQLGVKTVNMAGGKDSVIDYKMKFPNAYILDGFAIKVSTINEINNVI